MVNFRFFHAPLAGFVVEEAEHGGEQFKFATSLNVLPWRSARKSSRVMVTFAMLASTWGRWWWWGSPERHHSDIQNMHLQYLYLICRAGTSRPARIIHKSAPARSASDGRARAYDGLPWLALRASVSHSAPSGRPRE